MTYTKPENYDRDYQLGADSEKLIWNYIQTGHYEEANSILQEYLFHPSKDVCKIFITENNLLMQQMLEIYFLEKNNASISSSIWERYLTIDAFKQCTIQFKFLIRRLWFGFIEDSFEQSLNTFISEYSLTSEFMVVLTKYTVPEKELLSILVRLQHFLNSNKLKEEVLFYSSTFGDASSIDLNLFTPLDPISKSRWDIVTLNAQSNTSISKSHSSNSQKLEFILCCNNDIYVNEVIHYLNYINIPANMSGQITLVKNASSMASGYNYAMLRSNSKFKFYIHQDSFLISPTIIADCIQIFNGNPDIGLIGVAGCTILPEDAKWFNADFKNTRKMVYQDGLMIFLDCTYNIHFSNFEDAEALDGIFLATSYDIAWREDLFTHWHYYDISQCYEFRKHDMRTVVLNAPAEVLLHETTMKKDPHDWYGYYGHVFRNEYF